MRRVFIFFFFFLCEKINLTCVYMRIYIRIYVRKKKKKKKNSQKSYKTETKTAYFAENQQVFFVRVDVTSREGARVQGTRRRARTACAWGYRHKRIFVTDSKTRARGACCYFW